MTKDDLNSTEYNTFFQAYIQKSGSLDLIDGLVNSGKITTQFLEAIPRDLLEYRYEAGKWTIKEIIQHLIDTERIFANRALRIARKDQTALPGYDHESFAVHSLANRRTFEDLIMEYQALRQTTILLFKSFDPGMLMEIGTVSDKNLSARAVGFIIVGHETHHCDIIKQRYL
jgi:hypothetical protein